MAFFAAHFPEFHHKRHVLLVARGIHSHPLLWGAVVCSKVPQQSHNGNTTHLQPRLFSPQIYPVWGFLSHQQRDICQRSPAWPSAPRAHQQGCGPGTRDTPKSTSPMLRIPNWSSRDNYSFFLNAPTTPCFAPSSHTETKSLTPGSAFRVGTPLGMLVLLMIPDLQRQSKEQ